MDERIASVALLLPLCSKQFEQSLSICLISGTIKKTPVALHVSVSEI
jgi:hypothetical protein